MDGNIFEKLSKMRAAINKEHFSSFDELLNVISSKSKYYRLLPLYCFYENVATLTIVNLDDVKEQIKFQIPVELVGFNNAREYLYHMAFELNEYELTPDQMIITAEQYMTLLERMKEKKVTEEEILERYKIEKLTTMTLSVYLRCMTVLDKMKNK